MIYKWNTTEGQQKRQENLGSEGIYPVKIKWLGPEDEPKKSDEQKMNTVDLDGMDKLRETLSHGVASSSTELYIYVDASPRSPAKDEIDVWRP